MADFQACIPFVLRNEGGYQNDPNDAGNWHNGINMGTNFGISAPVAVSAGWPDGISLRSMTESEARQIWETLFWPGLEGVESNAVAAKILDMRASGLHRADRYVQQGLVDMGWSIAVDGIIGPETQSALNQEDPSAVLEMLARQQAAIYQDSADTHPSEAKYLAGWLSRAARLPYIAAVAGGLSLAGLAVTAALLWAARKS